MITAITIENFKGISEPVRLELRPITLLFGQNSAGKSSLLHALIYAREVFERHNLDADRTLSGGDNVDLGGFSRFVHNHDHTKEITLHLELDLSSLDLPLDFLRTLSHFSNVLPYLERLSGWITQAEVSVTVGWVGGNVVVTRYVVGLDGEPFAAIRYNADSRTAEIVDHNSDHPALAFQDPHEVENQDLPQGPEEDDASWDQDEEEGPSEWQAILAHVRSYAIGSDPESALVIRSQPDALPVWGLALDLALKLPTPEEIGGNPRREKDWADNIRLQSDLVVAVFSMVFVGTGQLVHDFLAGLRYLGPNRQVPPRGFSPSRTEEPGRWASGLAGWDLLFRSPLLVDRMNRLLREPSRLGVGYELEMAVYQEFDERDPILAALRAGRLDDLDNIAAWLTQSRTKRRLQFRPLDNPSVALEPADLGVGVSQLVPVVAAALDDTATGSLMSGVRPVLVEHPELNLHPRLQAELGDVFLEGALAEDFGGRIFLIETHSEQLTLRFLRRIRENTRGQLLFGMPVKPTAIGIWYVDRAHGPVTVKQILIDVEGEFVQPWPEDDTLFEQDFRERYT